VNSMVYSYPVLRKHSETCIIGDNFNPAIILSKGIKTNKRKEKEERKTIHDY